MVLMPPSDKCAIHKIPVFWYALQRNQQSWWKSTTLIPILRNPWLFTDSRPLPSWIQTLLYFFFICLLKYNSQRLNRWDRGLVFVTTSSTFRLIDHKVGNHAQKTRKLAQQMFDLLKKMLAKNNNTMCMNIKKSNKIENTRHTRIWVMYFRFRVWAHDEM